MGTKIYCGKCAAKVEPLYTLIRQIAEKRKCDGCGKTTNCGEHAKEAKPS
jgi:hypothetical protein